MGKTSFGWVKATPKKLKLMTLRFRVHQEKILPKGFLQLCNDEISDLVERTVLFLHSIMLEVGFISKGVNESDAYEKMPENWRGNNVYHFSYYHKTIPSLCCRVTCVPMFSDLAVYGLLEDETNEKNTVYHKIKVIDPLSTSCDSNALAIKIKDEFCFNLLVLLQEKVNFKPAFGLVGLIPECQHAIMEYLNVRNVLTMSRVNKKFLDLANSPRLWKHLFTRDFPDIANDENSNEDWKEKYKEEYERRKITARRVYNREFDQEELFRTGLAAVADYPYHRPDPFDMPMYHLLGRADPRLRNRSPPPFDMLPRLFPPPYDYDF